MMLKTLLLLLILSACLLAGNDGDLNFGSSCVRSRYDEDIVFTEVSTWEITTGGNVLGLDFINSPTSLILYGDNVNGYIGSIDPSTGAPGTTIELYSGNIGAFGISSSSDTSVDFYHSNDYIYADIFYSTDGGNNWNTIDNPAGSNGRGIDILDGILWQASSGITSGYYINRLELASGLNTVFQITEPQDQLSGLTCFDYSGSPALAVTTYDDGYVYIYEIIGRGVSYLGCGSIPVTHASCYGLTYDPGTDHFFLSYIDDENRYFISKLEYNTVALQRSTFGGIKSLLGSWSL